MTWNPLRITSVWVKVLYFVAWIFVGQIVTFALGSAGPPVAAALGQVTFLLWVTVAARSFRVAYEPVAPPRPWWKVTGRPAASFVLGSFWAVSAVASVATVVAEPEPYPNATFWIVSAVTYTVLAFFFLNSGIRQRRETR